MDKMTKKFNRIMEEAKSMFAVSQAMAKNNFPLVPACRIKGKTHNPDPPPKTPYPESLLKQQPTAELKKEVDGFFAKMNIDNPTWPETLEYNRQIVRYLKEALAQIDRKDEIIFAYESVNAPINPLLAINKDLLDALEQIRDLETECCSRCEGNGRLYADGKAHLMSENADTILCGNCGGSGRILPEIAQDIAEAAIAKAKKVGE